jgi:hypothetical protein
VRDGDLPEVESHYRSPGRKRSQTRGQTSKPRRITADAEDVSPDGKDGRFWSGSEEDDSLEEVPSVDNRRRARGGKASSAFHFPRDCMAMFEASRTFISFRMNLSGMVSGHVGGAVVNCIVCTSVCVFPSCHRFYPGVVWSLRFPGR